MYRFLTFLILIDTIYKYNIYYTTFNKISTTIMSRCQICNKRNQVGNKRSHSNIATKRKFKVNLQTKKIDGEKKRICTSCMRTINKVN